MWVPVRCWICRLWYTFPDFVEELPDSEEAEEGCAWAERSEPAVLLSGVIDIEAVRKRPEVREAQPVWCLYDNIHPTPSWGVVRSFLCGCGMTGSFHVMMSWEAAVAQVAEEDADASLLLSFLRQGRGRGGLEAEKVQLARLADRALKGDQGAVTQMATLLSSLGHAEAGRVAQIKVEVPW